MKAGDEDTELVLLEDEKPRQLRAAAKISDLQKIVKIHPEKEHLANVGGVKGLCDLLKVNPDTGISSDEVEARQRVYGVNKFDEPPHVTWFELFFEAFKDEAVIILCISAVVSFVAGLIQSLIGKSGGDEWIEGATIIVAVLVVATVTASNDYAKDIQFRQLKKQTADRKIRVLRDSKETYISVFDIVVGDVIVIFMGDRIAADGIFLPGLEALQTDESSVTGEAEPKKKDQNDPYLLSGYHVTSGSGRMVVTAVGMNSVWGQTMALYNEESQDTPLQEKLEELVTIIGKIGLAVAILVFLVLLGHYIYDSVHPVQIVPCSNNETEIELFNDTLPCSAGSAVPGLPGYIEIPSTWEANSLLQVLSAFIIAVTIVVVAVPEGLPLAVTISLAYSMRQMTRDQNLVRHLSACETMGGATTICSDKTGTLTENKMSVQSVWMFGSKYDLSELHHINDEQKRLIFQSCCLNNENGTIGTNKDGSLEFLGNVTECAILVFADKLAGNNVSSTLKSQYPVIHKKGFDSSRKRMSTVINFKDFARVFTKGAPEIIITRCNNIMLSNGQIAPFTSDLVNDVTRTIEGLAQKGLRTLAFAYKDMDSSQSWEEMNYETELVFIGVVGIEDPVRPEVPASVIICQNAGVVVRMVTGDNVTTASKIAQDCNIITKDGIILEGPKFSVMSDEELKDILPKLRILARSTPADKFRLVNLLREMGEVVAVTGDGTNDAPALHAADVGLAMGISGTEVAKQAADIIILDDNFASIVKSILWGRCVFDNVRKFLQFQLTVNVAALAIAFIGAITGYGTPLNAIQLLWVNLIMDTLAALALGTETPHPDLLKRKPYGREGKLITWTMWRNIIGQSLLQIATLAILLYSVNDNQVHMFLPRVDSGKDNFEQGDPSTHYTIIFNVFVLFQVFNEINSRKVNNKFNVFEGIFSNPLFPIILSLIVGIQVLIIQFGGSAVKTVPLDWDHWLICIGFAATALPLGFLLRLIKVPLEDWEEEHPLIL